MARLVARTKAAAGPDWMRSLKKRLPRHEEPEDQEWFLSQMIPAARRWYEAERSMLEERGGGHVMEMKEAFDKIRRDLGTSRVGRLEAAEMDYHGRRPTGAGGTIYLTHQPSGGAGRPPSKNVIKLGSSKSILRK